MGLEEYGYITGRSLLIKTVSLLTLFLLVKTKQDYILYALISSLATGGNYVFNVIHARKIVKFDFFGIHVRRHLKPVFLIAGIIFLSSIYNKIDVTMLNMMATDESVGFYSYAQKTINIVLTMASAVTAALLPTARKCLRKLCCWWRTTLTASSMCSTRTGRSCLLRTGNTSAARWTMWQAATATWVT